MSNDIHKYLKEEFNKNFQIGAQGLQACNASIAHNNQQIEYLLYENQIRKHEMEILKQNAQQDMNKLMFLERTITEERKQREQSDLILASRIADLTNERNLLMSYTKEIKSSILILFYILVLYVLQKIGIPKCYRVIMSLHARTVQQIY